MASQPQVSQGTLTPWSTADEYNKIVFAIRALLSKLQTATLVQVMACSNDGDVDTIGTVDVMPLVNQLDGFGNPTPHGTVYALPYLRAAAGNNGLIMDPQEGDIGVAVFASRDISKVVSTQDQANPGSARQFDFADGIYLGSILSDEAPTQYIQFNDDGISIVTPNDIKLQSNGDTDITAQGKVNLQSEGDTDITATGNIILSGATIQAGGTTKVVLQPLITWITGTLIPALASASIIVAPPPATALSVKLEGS